MNLHSSPTLALAVVITAACGAGQASSGSVPSAPPRAPSGVTSAASAESRVPLDELLPLPGCHYDVGDGELSIYIEDLDVAFSVSARNVSLYPREELGPLTARVSGALRFETAAGWRFGFGAAHEIALEGFGSLPPGSPVRELRRDADGLEVQLVVGWTRVDPSPFAAQRQSRFESYVTLSGRPCDSIARYGEITQPPRRDVSGELVFGPSEVELRDAPGSERTLVVRAESAVALFVQRRDRDWTLVELPSDRGASIRGWVETSTLDPALPRREPGRSASAALDGGEPPFGQRGRARIRVGARVFALPGAGPWAQVGEDAEFLVRRETSDSPWVVIVSAPNARVVGWRFGDPNRDRHAWVQSEHVLDFTPVPEDHEDAARF